MRRLGAILLAAGSSRRMGPTNKLLAELDGAPVVRHSALRLLDSGVVERLVVVTGHEPEHVRGALDALALEFVHNPSHLDGMGGSLATGARALRAHALDGVFVCLGDMPSVSMTTLGALARSLGSRRAIAAPTHGGTRGHPVLFGADHLDAMCELAGDRGARSILREHDVTLVEVDDVGVLLDVDTPDALAAVRASLETH